MKSLAIYLMGIAAWSSPLLCQPPAYTISTAAGGGGIDIADGALATNVQMGPSGVTVDAAGNLYISYGEVWEVTPDGVIHLFAGNPAAGSGYSGDGGPALGAQFNLPAGLALDVPGNLYIADASTNNIRKIDGNGVITTVAGGIGASGPAFGDGGQAAKAVLNRPTGVAVDAAGNLYIADFGDMRVRMVDQTGAITTVAGGGNQSPGDGGPATSALLKSPYGVAVDSAGNLYIAENNWIRKVTNGTISTVAGSGVASYSGDGGPAAQAGVNQPMGVAVDGAGNIYIAATAENRIRMVTPDGTIATIAGAGSAGSSGDGGPATSATLNRPIGVAVGADGSVYVVDSGNGRVRKLTPTAQ